MIANERVDRRVRSERADQTSCASEYPEQSPAWTTRDQAEQCKREQRHTEVEREEKRLPTAVHERQPRDLLQMLGAVVVTEQVKRHGLEQRQWVERPEVIRDRAGAFRSPRSVREGDELHRREPKSERDGRPCCRNTARLPSERAIRRRRGDDERVGSNECQRCQQRHRLACECLERSRQGDDHHRP